MDKFRLYDWNDIRLLLACADRGGFSGAAKALGIDQTTVSRRIGELEKMVGRPLFTRRRSGAAPTPVGAALLERARRTLASVDDFETAMHGLTMAPSSMVTLGASEGLLSYTLIPVLLRNSATPQPLDIGKVPEQCPPLAFTTALRDADIAIAATGVGDLPAVSGAMRVRRIGVMNFAPVAGQALLQTRKRHFQRFDELLDESLVDVAIYRPIHSLDGWNDVISRKCEREEALVMASNSRQAHQSVVEGKGVGLLPTYSSLYDSRLVMLDMPAPDLQASLWLIAHEDKLRDPAVRSLFDALADIFLASHWFRGGSRDRHAPHHGE